MQTSATARHARPEDVRLDPITSSVVEHGLGSVTDEMANVVVATAYSPLVRDLFDFTVALCNPRGEMVVQGVGMAIHLGALPAAVDTILQRFGNDMRPGDCVIMNDAYEGGMHLPNVILLTPNFADGELLGYAVTMAHHTDMGGHVPGSVPVNSRDGVKKDTVRNIEQVPEFVVNVVPFALAAPMNDSAAQLPYGESEFEAFGIVPAPSQRVRPPRVAAAPVAFECTLERMVNFGEGSLAANVVFGRIHLVHVSDSVLGADGTPDAATLDLIGRLGGDGYARTTERFTLERP